MTTTTAEPAGTRLTQILLACGIAYAVLHVVVNDVVAASLYPGYDSRSQAVSELSATGSPAKAFLTAFSPIWTVLWVAFGIGVRRAAAGRRALRITGALLIVHGIVALLWLLFPMTSRADMVAGTTAINDIGHIVMTGLTLVFVLAEIGFSAAAFGWRFRLYAIVSAAAVVVFGTLTGMQAPKAPAGEPTPWLGLLERLSIGPWLLWLTVLAMVLMTARTAQPVRTADPPRSTAAEGQTGG